MASDLKCHLIGTVADAYGQPIEISVLTGEEDGFGGDSEPAAVHIEFSGLPVLDKAAREDFRRVLAEAERQAEAHAAPAVSYPLRPFPVAETACPRDPPDCDAHLFGATPTVFNGNCLCLVCVQCGHHTGNANQGHYRPACSVTGTIREPHFCCPDPAFGCDLEAL